MFRVRDRWLNFIYSWLWNLTPFFPNSIILSVSFIIPMLDNRYGVLSKQIGGNWPRIDRCITFQTQCHILTSTSSSKIPHPTWTFLWVYRSISVRVTDCKAFSSTTLCVFIEGFKLILVDCAYITICSLAFFAHLGIYGYKKVCQFKYHYFTFDVRAKEHQNLQR